MVVVLVVYDISDDAKRQRAARTIQAWGLSRIQRSAYAGTLLRARARDLARRLERIIDPDTDTVHILTLQRSTWEKTIVLGKRPHEVTPHATLL